MQNSVKADFAAGPWKPVVEKKPPKRPQACPFCDQPYHRRRRTVDGLLTKAVHQAVFGIVLLLVGVLRVARLAVAGALCTVGLVGSCFQRLGLAIAHKEDRCLLTRRKRTQVP